MVIGPGVTIRSGATIHAFSHLEEATIGPGCSVGPFARLRPGADLLQGAKVGNFCEVKKAVIGEGAKVNHLTYVGDAEVGAKANLGAGTITCNYDGVNKHFTHIGAGSFVGSNSALVAPVTIGDNAYVASGSVITSDVPEDALAFGRARQENKSGLAPKLKRRQRRRETPQAGSKTQRLTTRGTWHNGADTHIDCHNQRGRPKPHNGCCLREVLLYIFLLCLAPNPALWMSEKHTRLSASTRLRNYFLTGLIICAPLAITAYLTWSFIIWVDGWVKPYLPAVYNPDNYLPFSIPGFGLLTALIFITAVGFLTANLIGRTIIAYGESILDQMPLIRGVYKGLKQIFSDSTCRAVELVQPGRADRVPAQRHLVHRIPGHRNQGRGGFAPSGYRAGHALRLPPHNAQPDVRLFAVRPPRRGHRA